MGSSNSDQKNTQPKFAPFRLAVRADVMRLSGRYSFGNFIKACLFNRTFRPIFTMRLCQAASELPPILRELMIVPCKVLHHWAQHWAGMDFPWMTLLGPGFVITHGWGLVISSKSTIGSNVTVYHGVTIGQKHKIYANGRVKSYPIIQDEVWIGPHAVIVGGVVIGRGSRIAPGTIVTGDVEPYSIVGGNPMRVLKTDAPVDVVNPAKLSM